MTTFKRSEALRSTEVFHRILREAFPDVVIQKEDGNDWISDWTVFYNGVKYEKLVHRAFGANESSFSGIKVSVYIGKSKYRRLMVRNIDSSTDPMLSFDITALQERHAELFALLTTYAKSQQEVVIQQLKNDARKIVDAAEIGVNPHDLEDDYHGKYKMALCETPEVWKEIMKLLKELHAND